MRTVNRPARPDAPDAPNLTRRTLLAAAGALALAHPLARARRPTLDDVLRERLVVYSPEAPQSQDIDDWLARRHIARNVAVEVRSGYSACAMAAAGVGVAFVDDLSARAHQPGEVRFLAIARAPRFPIFRVTSRARPPSQLGKRFLRLVRAQLDLLQRTPITRASLG